MIAAWNDEHRRAHERLRDAFAIVRAAADPPGDTVREAWQGFYIALVGHLTGEDGTLLPAVRAQHPTLAETIDALETDHRAILERVASLDQYLAREHPTEAADHLDDLRAVLFFHFLQEESQLGEALAALTLDTNPEDALGPL